MSDNSIPMFKWGEFARYKNDDGTTSCYRGQRFVGAFDNNSAFCDLFASFAIEVTKKDARIKELEGLVEKAILKKDFSNYSSFLDSLKKNGFSFFIAMDMGDSIEYQIYNDIESKEEEIKSNYDLLCACENIAKAYGERIKELGIQQEIG